MSSDIFGAAIAFVLGAGVGVLNYFLSAYMLKKHPQNFSAVTIVRQIIQVGFIVAIFIFGGKTSWDVMYLLVGAVFGISLTMFVSTKKLLKLNNEMKSNSEKREDSNG